MSNHIKPATRAHPGPQSQFITLNDGISAHLLFWQCQARPVGTPCMLLHGFTNDAHIWDSLADKLANYFPVYAIDFRGHGDSAWDPQARYSHEILADDVAQIATQLELTQFHLIGHSLGARIGMLFADSLLNKSLLNKSLLNKGHPKKDKGHPTQLNSFVIIDTGPEVRAAGVSKVRKDAESMPLYFKSVEQYASLLSSIYVQSSQDKILHLARHGLKALPNGGYTPKTDPAFTTALWNPDSYKSNSQDLRTPLKEQLWQALARIEAPTLLLNGQISAILSRQVAKRMTEQTIPDARMHQVSGAGHAVMMDNPREFEALTLDFLHEIEAISKRTIGA